MLVCSEEQMLPEFLQSRPRPKVQMNFYKESKFSIFFFFFGRGRGGSWLQSRQGGGQRRVLGAVVNIEYLVDWAAASPIIKFIQWSRQKMLTADIKHCKNHGEKHNVTISWRFFFFIMHWPYLHFITVMYHAKIRKASQVMEQHTTLNFGYGQNGYKLEEPLLR